MLAVPARLRPHAYFCGDAIGQSLPCRVPFLTVALLVFTHLLLPIWAQILAQPLLPLTAPWCSKLPSHVGAQARPPAQYQCCPLPTGACSPPPGVYPLLTHIFHCPIGLLFQNTSSKNKLLRISRWQRQIIKPRAGSILSWGPA